jgi:hypothetical protein
MTAVDEELLVMSKLADEMDKLDKQSQQRVLRWLAARYPRPPISLIPPPGKVSFDA